MQLPAHKPICAGFSAGFFSGVPQCCWGCRQFGIKNAVCAGHMKKHDGRYPEFWVVAILAAGGTVLFFVDRKAAVEFWGIIAPIIAIALWNNHGGHWPRRK